MTFKPSYEDLETRIRILEHQLSDFRKIQSSNSLHLRRFREIVWDVENIAVQGYDKDRRVIFWNQASTKLYGYTQEEALGKKLEELIIPPAMVDEIKGLIQRWVEHGEKIPASELLLMGKDKKPVPVFSSHVMLETQDSFELFCIDIDLKPLKKAEKEKLEASRLSEEHRKLALVGQVAGKMAHDFNNILGIIMGNAELALMDFSETEAKSVLRLIVDQTVRGKNLTRNLLAFAKHQEPRQEYFAINNKINFVLNLMADDLEGITVEKKLEFGMPDLLADPGMMEHTLVNLVQNAVHAVSRVECPRINIRTFCRREKGGDTICIEISDNGCGIPMEHVDRIYEPSFTLKGGRDETGSYADDIKGTGYGMSNVRRYVEQHRGRIFMESLFRAGTRVLISLPVIQRELTEDEKTEIQNQAGDSTGKNILLVEDETAISDIQYRILTKAPCRHRVDIAPNGQAAMDLFDRNAYDLVSLDYLLPGDINGMDVYTHIRNKNPSIPILFVSGNIEFLESIRALAREDANMDHLTKPCLNREYVEGITRLLTRAFN